MEQKTNEWHEARMGRFTASSISKLMCSVDEKKAGTLSYFKNKTAKDYILEKIAETMTGEEADQFTTKEMQWGIDCEPFAKAHFQEATGKKITDVAIVVADFSCDVSCSPDGLIEAEKSGIEIKCPFNSRNHVHYLTVGDAADLKEVNETYYWQVQMSLLLTGYLKWYFVSYDPRFSDKYRMHIAEIERNESDIELLKSRILSAAEIKNNILKQLS
ncbi:MAG TPA: YqaJ viral recombinase family protein [Paludibacteraceae bacterium]|nr:YqaJ viral recombinase family protein [Paludibacteraceae bacterium]